MIFKRLMLVASFLLSACASQKVDDFAKNEPLFLPEDFFIGELQADGMFFDRWNKVRRTFHLDLKGEVKGGAIHLTENLTYDDGESLTRVYVIKKKEDSLYDLTASDGLVGPAHIRSAGNTLRWSYVLRQKVGDSEWDLTFDDWMFRLSDDVVLNRAYASKFGLSVGEVFMLIRKVK